MENKTTARVILTLDCNRACDYCVNKQPGMLEQAISLYHIKQLQPYKSICITGGEPMVRPNMIRTFINQVYLQCGETNLYLYCADYTGLEELCPILNDLSGITYTLHAHATQADIAKVLALQECLECMELLSRRLIIHPSIDCNINLKPRAWDVINIRYMGSDCYLPDNEDLFILEERCAIRDDS